MTDIIPGERGFTLEPPPLPVIDDDRPTQQVRSDAAVLTPADLVWVQSLDPDHLDPDDVSALRSLRNRAGRRDEQRLLNRVLRVDDAARAEAARRAPIEHELRTIENMMNRPADSEGRRRILQLKAESAVRDTIADGIAEAERLYRADPRRVAVELSSGRPDTIMREEAEREHRARVAAIQASRETLLAGALHDVGQEWQQTHRAGLFELAKRKQELLGQLDNPNPNGNSAG
jgi:hypothetical protein